MSKINQVLISDIGLSRRAHAHRLRPESLPAGRWSVWMTSLVFIKGVDEAARL
jgi:hypothetical protein